MKKKKQAKKTPEGVAEASSVRKRPAPLVNKLPFEVDRPRRKKAKWAKFDRQANHRNNKPLLAQYMREFPTKTELLMADVLASLQLQFRFQPIMLGYIPDFYIPYFGVIIEVDGDVHSHQEAYDAKRDYAFRSQDIGVVRVTARELFEDNVKVADTLIERLRTERDTLSGNLGSTVTVITPEQGQRHPAQKHYQLAFTTKAGRFSVTFRPYVPATGYDHWMDFIGRFEDLRNPEPRAVKIIKGK